MKVDLLSNKDFLSGLMFTLVGAAAIFIARDYPMGSLLRMGPGYFPIMLGGILVLFGIYIMAQGVLKPEKIKESWSLRALVLLPVSGVVFGVLVENTGFIPALVALTLMSAAAGKEFRLVEVLLLALVMTAGSVGLFIYGLGLPYPLLKGL